MSNLVNAILKHDLGVDELISLPELINRKGNSPIKKEDVGWVWTRERLDSEFLHHFWSRSPLWYTENEWSENDLAIIAGPDNFTIFLNNADTIVIQNHFSWAQYNEFEEDNVYVKNVVAWLCEILGVDQMLFTSDESVSYLEKDLSWSKIIQVFRDENCEFEILNRHGATT